MPKRRTTPLENKKVESNSCSIDLRLKILHELPFFKDLPHEAVTEINKLFNETHFAQGDIIYLSGEKANRLCVIASGSVKLTKTSAAGDNILIDILKQGEFFGNLEPFDDAVYRETAVVQTSSCIIKIDSNNFRSVMNKYPSAALSVLDILTIRLREAQEVIEQLSTKSVEYRIATALLKLVQKLGEQKEVGYLIQIPLSRIDLAGMTGTTPETASRIISRLQKEEIIQTGRKWIAIKNVDKLKEMVESD